MCSSHDFRVTPGLPARWALTRARAALIGLALAAVTVTALPLPGAPAAGAEPNQVMIDNFTFTPAVLTVKAGTSVTWTNRDDIPHTVREDHGGFKSSALDTGDAYSYTFTSPGEYSYFCSLHPHMTGTVIVETN